MAKEICAGCWHTAPKMTTLVVWPGPLDGIKGQALCVRCWVDLTGGVPDGALKDGASVREGIKTGSAFSLALHR